MLERLAAPHARDGDSFRLQAQDMHKPEAPSLTPCCSATRCHEVRFAVAGTLGTHGTRHPGPGKLDNLSVDWRASPCLGLAPCKGSAVSRALFPPRVISPSAPLFRARACGTRRQPTPLGSVKLCIHVHPSKAHTDDRRFSSQRAARATPVRTKSRLLESRTRFLVKRRLCLLRMEALKRRDGKASSLPIFLF